MSPKLSHDDHRRARPGYNPVPDGGPPGLLGRPRPGPPPVRPPRPQPKEEPRQRLPLGLPPAGRERRRPHRSLPRRRLPPPQQRLEQEQGRMPRRPLHPDRRLAPARRPREPRFADLGPDWHDRRTEPTTARSPRPPPPTPGPRTRRHHHRPRRLKPRLPSDQTRRPSSHGPWNRVRVSSLILTVSGRSRVRVAVGAKVKQHPQQPDDGFVPFACRPPGVASRWLRQPRHGTPLAKIQRR